MYGTKSRKGRKDVSSVLTGLAHGLSSQPSVKTLGYFLRWHHLRQFTAATRGYTLTTMKRNSLSAFVFLSAICLVLPFNSASAQEVKKAIAVLHSSSGSQVMGTVTFTKTADGVQVVADLTGLKPGKHGFHIHEFGDCSAPDATSAGAHFNPTNDPHAGHDAAKRHVGDLGNIEADSSGKAHLELTDKIMTMSGDKSIIGRGVIVHEKADDLKTQPTGDAGGRLACGVIGVAKS